MSGRKQQPPYEEPYREEQPPENGRRRRRRPRRPLRPWVVFLALIGAAFLLVALMRYVVVPLLVMLGGRT